MVLWQILVVRVVQQVPPNAVFLVLDAIEPYESLWTEKKTLALASMLSGARATGHTVLFTKWVRVRGDPDDVLNRKGHWSMMLPSKDARLIKGLHAPSDQIIPVVNTNAMKNEAVCETVGKNPIVLCGMWTESCIVNTARAAADDNISVTVVSSCCGGHVPVSWLGLWTLQQLYADVVHALAFSEKTD